jgi:hypothetical protein
MVSGGSAKDKSQANDLYGTKNVNITLREKEKITNICDDVADYNCSAHETIALPNRIANSVLDKDSLLEGIVK